MVTVSVLTYKREACVNGSESKGLKLNKDEKRLNWPSTSY